LDTEESWYGGSKPVTKAGKLATKWAKEYFNADAQGLPTTDVRIGIEFDTNEPLPVCLRKHRGNFGRLICYVYKNEEPYNLRVIKEGWSPYFVKYGRSRLYHEAFLQEEAYAQSQGIGIWDPGINSSGNKRDYERLIPWWYYRESVVQDYRQMGRQGGALSVRLDYDTLVEAAKAGSEMTVFCDLQNGISRWAGGGALIFAGSKNFKFNLWIPDRDSDPAQVILRLIETRYVTQGRGYVYISGRGSMYPNQDGTPQIVLDHVNQLADLPPGR
jgi:micrococcal nuclease